MSSNPLDFGAKLNGIHDDTAAFQAAAESGRVLLPAPPRPKAEDKEKYGDVWLTYSGRRIGCGLYRGPWHRVGMWAHVSVLGRWCGIEVRFDPKVIGSKLMWTFGDIDIGWLE